MKVKKYKNGGVNPKNKAAGKPIAKTRAQEIEEAKMVGARRAEDLKIAEDIKKDIRSEVGPGTGRPSTNKGNVTLSTAKTQAISKGGDRKPDTQKYTRGELAAQFGGRKQQPIYRTGETLGYAPGREVKSGAGFTAKPSMPSRGVQLSGLPKPLVKKKK